MPARPLPARPGASPARRIAASAWLAASAVAGTFAGASASAAPVAGESGLEGAISLVATSSAEYLGARDQATGLRPGFYAARGRVTVSSGGGSFAALRQAAVTPGLGIELARTDTYSASFGLRLDGGRSESGSRALAGMGSIQRTVRARVGASWYISDEWRLDGSWTLDMFRRGGGDFGDITLQRQEWIGPTTQLTLDGVLTLGGRRYLQTWFGVSPEQAARTGYPVYMPRSGPRDIAFSATLRTDLSHDWVLLCGAAVSRVLGPAADSPLTLRATGYGLTAGLGYRF